MQLKMLCKGLNMLNNDLDFILQHQIDEYLWTSHAYSSATTDVDFHRIAMNPVNLTDI